MSDGAWSIVGTPWIREMLYGLFHADEGTSIRRVLEFDYRLYTWKKSTLSAFGTGAMYWFLVRKECLSTPFGAMKPA